MSVHQVPGLYFQKGAIHDRGVFCLHDLRAGDIVEVAPVIVLASSEGQWLSQSRLYNYYFQWGRNGDEFAIALGLGSLYNHSSPPNTDFTPDIERRVIVFSAIHEIPAGEELTIDYHAGLQGRNVWFKVISRRQ